MVAPWLVISGQTSAQYFVQATMRSSLPIAARITVALGCKETTRCGVWSEGTVPILQGFGIEVCGEGRNVASNVSTFSGSRHVTILGMYSPQLLDHFQNPRNPGEVVNPDASVQLENPACGDILKLSIKIANGQIAEIGFLAKGCVPAMACGSALTLLVKGRTVAAARRLRREELVQAVGGLPEASAHASHLAMDALAAALKQLKI